MSFKNDIKKLAFSQCVQLVAMTGIESYDDYLAEVRSRLKDTGAGFDSKHHASHKYLDGFEKTPDLISLLDPTHSEIIRRNAAISMANTGKGRKKAVTALKKQLGNGSLELNEYFVWAIETLEKKEVV